MVQAGAELGDDLHGQVTRRPRRPVGRDAVRDPVQERARQHIARPGQVHRLTLERRDVRLAYAGVGDTVLIVQEGWSASTVATGKPGAAIDSAIVGVVDRIDLLENE